MAVAPVFHVMLENTTLFVLLMQTAFVVPTIPSPLVVAYLVMDIVSRKGNEKENFFWAEKTLLYAVFIFRWRVRGLSVVLITSKEGVEVSLFHEKKQIGNQLVNSRLY
ncbi:hypothetical protein V8E51_008587 [Hyaloscypha variabilis]